MTKHRELFQHLKMQFVRFLDEKIGETKLLRLATEFEKKFIVLTL